MGCRYSTPLLLSSVGAADLLSPFAMWPAVPASDTTGTPSRDGIMRRRWTCPASLHEGDAIAVPTFTDLRLTGTPPGYTPAASRHSHRSVCAATVEPLVCGSTERARDRLPRARYCASPYPPGWSWLTNRGASDASSLSLYLSASLARPWRLAVSPRGYVVRAAPSLPCISTTCPQLLATAASVPGGVLPPGISAPRGAQPTSSIINSRHSLTTWRITPQLWSRRCDASSIGTTSAW
jgi:hypothetical protein